MSDRAIVVESLGKAYRVGRVAKRADTWPAAIGQAALRPFRYLQERLTTPTESDIVWALKDVSFEVKPGEVIGIIGRNGAGKSTLLKILSRITDPTTGKATVRGHVNSLLEVGTGFHPELTGRENIFMNAAIHGMRRREIERKLDQIIDFAEIDRYVDTPVKRYSSGMYTRLAFSVAAHLEPDILVVDEVLAVGDFAFQRKCLGKMEDVASHGRTVLFVSHQMEAVGRLCKRCILLHKGTIRNQGGSREVIENYLSLNSLESCAELRTRTDRSGEGRLRFVETWIEDASGRRVTTVQTGDTVKLVAIYELKPGEQVSNLEVAMAVNSARGIPVTDLCNNFSGQHFEGAVPPRGRVDCVLEKLPLNQGRYSYNLEAVTGSRCVEDHVDQAGVFDVEPGDYFGTGRIPDSNRLMMMNQRWSLIRE